MRPAQCVHINSLLSRITWGPPVKGLQGNPKPAEQGAPLTCLTFLWRVLLAQGKVWMVQGKRCRLCLVQSETCAGRPDNFA